MNVIKLSYNTCDILATLKINNEFNKRFEILNIVKKTYKKVAIAVYDKIRQDKCFLKAQRYNDLNSYQQCTDVYELLQKNTHENIVRVYDIIVDKCNDLYIIVSQFIEGLDLCEYFNKSDNKLELWDLLTIMYNLLHGLSFIHELGIIHGDIKMENIMWNNGTIKITDFDLAITEQQSICVNTCKRVYGTENYMAPESFDLCTHSIKSDIWSAGVLLYKLVTSKFPYKHAPNQFVHLYIRNNFKNLDFDTLDSYKNMYDEDTIYFIKYMLEFNELVRPDTHALIEKFEKKYTNTTYNSTS